MEISRTVALVLSRVGLLIGCSLCLVACGSDGDDRDDGNFTDSASVVDLRADDTTIRVGEGTVVTLDFTYDTDDVFDDNDAVNLVVRIPSGLSYRDDTSEVDSVGGDQKVGARITPCAGGETYLTYILDEFDLDGAENPPGDADARLTFTVDAITGGTTHTLSARAATFNSAFTCGGAFGSERDESIVVIE